MGDPMARKSKETTLTKEEKRVIKALLNNGWRNQDIQALVNIGRAATINSGRITGIKKDQTQTSASNDEVAFFELKKKSFDPKTGLNVYDDERLVRAREAMTLAVQAFNNPLLNFKTEVFLVLVNIAWTYLLHEYYNRKGVYLIGDDGRSLLLSEMLKKRDCPLSEGIKNNLWAIKKLRDDVEHLILGLADRHWSPLFQACCLNFDKTLCEMFGEELSLASELSLALQFARLNIDQLETTAKYPVPNEIQALDAGIIEGMTEEQQRDIEFQFQVIYTLSEASKSQTHFQFVTPDSAEGKEISTVLAKRVPSDHLFPYKPKAVVQRVQKGTKNKFTTNDHSKAWKYFKARPASRSQNPHETDKSYCIYHKAHGDYTYNDAWIALLIESANKPETLSAIRNIGKK